MQASVLSHKIASRKYPITDLATALSKSQIGNDSPVIGRSDHDILHFESLCRIVYNFKRLKAVEEGSVHDSFTASFTLRPMRTIQQCNLSFGAIAILKCMIIIGQISYIGVVLWTVNCAFDDGCDAVKCNCNDRRKAKKSLFQLRFTLFKFLYTVIKKKGTICNIINSKCVFNYKLKRCHRTLWHGRRIPCQRHLSSTN